MSSEVAPVRIERKPPSAIVIAWSDGEEREYSFRELQDACPCASCREKRAKPPVKASPFQVIKVEETQPLELVAMRPIGHYAYGLAFNYGCTQGIYTFETLRKLGKVVPAAAGG